MQSKKGGGLIDGTVTIFDPRSWEAVKPCLGLHGKFEEKSNINLFHNLNCLIEAKKAHDVTGKNSSLIKILGQLKRYHVQSTKNINAFSIAIRGFHMAFFTYIHDWHHTVNFFNKGTHSNGFLCLYLTDEGIQILPQYDTYEPQNIAYNMVGGCIW